MKETDGQLIWPDDDRGALYFLLFKFRVYVLRPRAELVANCCETGLGWLDDVRALCGAISIDGTALSRARERRFSAAGKKSEGGG